MTCTGNCNQGRNCTCRKVTGDYLTVREFERQAYRELERVDSSSLDIGLLIASGAMSRPVGQPYPLTLTLRQRFSRWVRVRFGHLIYR